MLHELLKKKKGLKLKTEILRDQNPKKFFSEIKSEI
jgi:hypothetical protein